MKRGLKFFRDIWHQLTETIKIPSAVYTLRQSLCKTKFQFMLQVQQFCMFVWFLVPFKSIYVCCLQNSYLITVYFPSNVSLAFHGKNSLTCQISKTIFIGCPIPVEGNGTSTTSLKHCPASISSHLTVHLNKWSNKQRYVRKPGYQTFLTQRLKSDMFYRAFENIAPLNECFLLLVVSKLNIIEHNCNIYNFYVLHQFFTCYNLLW